LRSANGLRRTSSSCTSKDQKRAQSPVDAAMESIEIRVPIGKTWVKIKNPKAAAFTRPFDGTFGRQAARL